MKVESKFVNVDDRKAHVYLLLYVILWPKLSNRQKDFIGKTEEMDAELHNLAKLVWKGKYYSYWKRMVWLRFPHLQLVLKEQFSCLAELDPVEHTTEEQFQAWLDNQERIHGKWSEIKSSPLEE